MSVSKTEFVEWKDSKVTQEAVKNIKEVVEDVAGALIETTNSDPIRDAYSRGFIRGVRSLLAWEPEYEDNSEGS